MLKKICYAIVALLFGTIGIHNFCEGNWQSGTAKLIITIGAAWLLTGWAFYIVSTLIGLWVIFDIVEYCINGKSYQVQKLFKK